MMSAPPNQSIGPQPFAEQLDSKDRSQGRLDIEEDSGTGCGHMMDSPIPEEGAGSRPEDATDGEAPPRREAQVRKGKSILRGAYRTGQNPDDEHHGADQVVLAAHYGRAVGLQQFFAEQFQARAIIGTDDEEVADRAGVSFPVVAWLPPRTTSAAPTVDAQKATQPVKSIARPQRGGGCGQKDRHGAAISDAWLTVVR